MDYVDLVINILRKWCGNGFLNLVCVHVKSKTRSKSTILKHNRVTQIFVFETAGNKCIEGVLSTNPLT